MIRRCIPVLLCLICGPALAGTAYQCTAANGKVSYQDKPCPGSQHQQVLQLDDSMPEATASPPLPHATTATAPAPPRPVQLPSPAAPLPVMYACVRATDGKSYLSDNGQPAPYQVPFGILGAGGLPLSQVYGAPNSAGASAPELNHGRVSPALVGNYFVWVQDQCRELSRSETCRALRDAYDDNASKLQRAFKSDQPPLEKRERELLAQLQNC